MSWRSVFGLDAVEFVIFWASAITASLTLGVLMDKPELTFLLLATAAIGYGFLRRRALRHLPAGEQVSGGKLLQQVQDDQAAATDYFERRIQELEERLDFAERLLARGQEERPKAGNA
ncbi:MAG TPA: hypothetical protein VLB00_13375 [Gemmatimonadales bacterium]|nr:hypothetical protein [Gemmatimonadales bacterium]HSE53178.1 hypothetical protein [Gemmatimonadales bacterium]